MGRAYYNEIDPYAAQWLRNLIAAGLITPGDVDTRSIVDVRPADVAGYERCHFFAGIGVWDYALGLAGWPADRPVWTGSCPCQPFSAAGRQAGFSDERHLWPAWFDLIRQCRPDTVIGEQVEAAVRLGWLDAVFADLEGEDYACGAVVLGAHSVGAPHIRQRLWFVADANGRDASAKGLQRGRQYGQQPQDRVAGLMADAPGEQRARALQESSGEPGLGGEGMPAGGCGDAGGLGDAPLGRSPREQAQPRPPGRHVAEAAIGAGPYASFDWLPCRDGKARPTQPGLQPLVDGAAFKLGSGSAFEGRSRVGMLRCAGNAINAETAAEFLTACLASLPTPSPIRRSAEPRP